MATPVYNIPQVVTGSVTSVGAATEIEIACGDSVKVVQLERVSSKHTAGSATTSTPRIHRVPGGTAGNIDMVFQGSATPIADLFDVEAQGAVSNTYENGKLYLLPTPNAGADNVYDYVVVYRVLA